MSLFRALKFRMTNSATGASTVTDAGGSAIFDLFPDGSQPWHVIGPVPARFKAGASNILQSSSFTIRAHPL